MASSAEFVEYAVEQLSGAGAVTARKMFGEYGLYLDGKLVALVCDDQLFVKRTEEGARRCEAAGELDEAPPYPGAKPALRISERLEDRDWLADLLRLTHAELPAPKPRRKR